MLSEVIGIVLSVRLSVRLRTVVEFQQKINYHNDDRCYDIEVQP